MVASTASYARGLAPLDFGELSRAVVATPASGISPGAFSGALMHPMGAAAILPPTEEDLRVFSAAFLPNRHGVFYLAALAGLLAVTPALAADGGTGDNDTGMRNLLACGDSEVVQHQSAIPAGFADVEISAVVPTSSVAFLQASNGPPETFSIESAVEWALGHNREIQRLRFGVDAAIAADRGSRLLYYPSLDIAGRSLSVGPAKVFEIPGPGGVPIRIEASTTDITSTASLTLTQPVYMFGSFELARQGTSISLDQARLQLARAEQTVRRDVESAFLQASLARALLDVAGRAVDTAGERLRIAQLRFDAGEVARFEVLRSEVSLATTREELLQSETASELALSALVQKLGLPLDTAIDISPPDAESVEPVAPELTLDEARQMALENRLDLRALQLAVDLAEVGVQSQRNRPSLVFQGSYSLSDRETAFSSRESWSVVLGLSYPLYDSGRARASMDEAGARRDALAVQVEETRTLVELEVESAWRELGESLERITVARTTLESAREAVRIAELGYSEGVITYIDYQDADLGYRRAETLHLQAVYQYLTAKSRLAAALGVLEPLF